MIPNVIVLGCGRSGSSMVAGSIFSTGKYNMPGTMHPANEFNPKGYFETNTINAINDDILRATFGFRSTQGLWQGWIGSLHYDDKCYIDSNITKRISDTVKDEPYLIKDPRLSYTLSSWIHLVYGAKYILCFRHPSEFLSSIIYHCQHAEYLKKIVIDQEFFENVWISMNQYILTNYKYLNPLFINYNQVLYSDGLDKISEFIGEEVNKDFPSKRLRNARRGIEVKESTAALYDQLCCLANCPEELK